MGEEEGYADITESYDRLLTSALCHYEHLLLFSS